MTAKEINAAARAHAKSQLGEAQFKSNKDAARSIIEDFKAGAALVRPRVAKSSAKVQKNWDEFWAELCLNEDGTLNVEQVKRELSDFREVMDSVSEVYDQLTKGRISKPNTCAKVVIGEVEALQQQEIDDAVTESYGRAN